MLSIDLHRSFRYTILESSSNGARMKTEVSTVTTKGQLVIPSKLRRKYSIKKGTKVAFVEEENRLILQPLTAEFIRSLRGCLGKDSKALEFLLEEPRRDRNLRSAPPYEAYRSRC